LADIRVDTFSMRDAICFPPQSRVVIGTRQSVLCSG
jgi:hypothetical protein